MIACLGTMTLTLSGTYLVTGSMSAVPSWAAPKIVAVLDSLAFYASRGQTLNFCRSNWDPGYPAPLPASCHIIGDLTMLQDKVPILTNREFIWVMFDRTSLSIGELIRLWGTPQLVWGRQGRVGLQWEFAELDISMWLYWGDPHKTPDGAVLTLEAASGQGRIGPG